MNGNSIEPEQNEISKSVEPDKPVTITQENQLDFERFGDDFSIDKIKPDEIGAEMVGVGDLDQEQECQINNVDD